ncbi:MAG TPA: hypothetical protein PLL30_10540 [Candidatus Krumholzibacteria bacterium]|nr:hypothetical protein [Candidatus Krumholzibacteria bacterium]HPD72200.1 hypothetical protein [Candidatus Krumholzibacteria bacterium]HRY40868.1 hypothetical protein [Candidatus Krumholzibacteria bacterium]
MSHRELLATAAAVAVALVLAGCDDEDEIATDRDTLTDPIADVAALGGYLFTTNEDRSGHGGSQIDLFKFAPGGFPEGRFGLGLNGMGYLAACSDGESLYLQARGTGQLFAVSPVGEIGWTRADPFVGSHALACGIAWRADVDSFVVIYRDPGTTTYTTVQYGPGFAGESSLPETHELSLFDPATGVRAVTWLDGWLWALGADTTGAAVVQGFAGGVVTRYFTLPDETACGLTAVDGTLVVAYPDRRFEAIDDEKEP